MFYNIETIKNEEKYNMFNIILKNKLSKYIYDEVDLDDAIGFCKVSLLEALQKNIKENKQNFLGLNFIEKTIRFSIKENLRKKIKRGEIKKNKNKEEEKYSILNKIVQYGAIGENNIEDIIDTSLEEDIYSNINIIELKRYLFLKLNSKQRILFTMKIKGHSEKDIIKHLGITRQWVFVNLNKIKELINNYKEND